LNRMVPVTGDKFDAISIHIASADQIRKWSRGEVRKPETINYRTFKPEKEGLFCERIFGPVKDWECGCGKYKKVKHRGIVCDRCGVEITESKVRRDWMGHIELAVPVSHIWFFKATPSVMGNLLDMSVRTLERVLYFEEHVVTDPGKTDLKAGETLAEEQYQTAREEYGADAFSAKMGAEGIKALLEQINLDELSEELKRELSEATSIQVKKKANKRLRIVDAMRTSGNHPTWMILEMVPVIPPDLRPLVPLDGGRYATSDLNDLYRRVINRNNRLKRLIELRAPDVILRNEKRMLQEAVDALFDNGRHGRVVLGAGNRPLKSLSEMLKGKQGRFRQNLLGKRVDYSGRSVIVVGPELKLHQCGLPKKMALELFEPFIIHRLKERGIATTIKAAKKAIANERPEVWDILEEVTRNHPVLLNRAPTLHRLGIQAFEPVLIEGKAIRVHPLVCTAFNADFDGDQMAVHVPLLPAAQLEARLLMLASRNILSPAHGRPIAIPSQDIILGLAYITKPRKGARGEGRIFRDLNEVRMARELDQVELHAQIKVRLNGSLVDTTVGRAILYSELPEDTPFESINRELNKSSVEELIATCYRTQGCEITVELLDRLKTIGFKQATLAGISVAIDDMLISQKKESILAESRIKVETIEKQYQQGLITDGERYNKIIDLWTHATDEVGNALFKDLEVDKQGFNSIYLMADSGARGSKQQIRQLSGMRGLMAKPSGDIIESPILSNFREGLTVLEYFISTHGARKGLADTALKTAEAGYLTRRMVDVAQDVIIREHDCGTLSGIVAEPLIEGGDRVQPLTDRIFGRVALIDVVDPVSGDVLCEANQEISEKIAQRIEDAGIEHVQIRSVLTCETGRGICAFCYGRDLATGRMVEVGEAVGIIAAQSIGEPGTQLTMKTFHIGGAATHIGIESKVVTSHPGVIRFHNVRTATNPAGETICLSRNGEMILESDTGKELERYPVPSGAILSVSAGDTIKKSVLLMSWDPYTMSIVSEATGQVKFEDLVEGVTMLEEVNEASGTTERVVIESKENLHPQISITDETGQILAFYTIPAGAHITVSDGESITSGDVLAKTPRKISKTKDITGGLPRVAELLEARRPKDPALISHIDGVVELGETVRGQRKIRTVNPHTKRDREYTIPHGKHLNVQSGDWVTAGQQLTDGPIVPQDILEVRGEAALQRYLLEEIQDVYRLQGVRINDKHIEILIRQMLRKVHIVSPGDTTFLADEQIDKAVFQAENDRVREAGGEPANAEPLLLGITKASLGTESFIAAASFQQTTRVLTDAATRGKVDNLTGLKENVIIGHLIPAGTGSIEYQNPRIIVKGTSEEDETRPDEEDVSEVEAAVA